MSGRVPSSGLRHIFLTARPFPASQDNVASPPCFLDRATSHSPALLSSSRSPLSSALSYTSILNIVLPSSSEGPLIPIEQDDYDSIIPLPEISPPLHVHTSTRFTVILKRRANSTKKSFLHFVRRSDKTGLRERYRERTVFSSRDYCFFTELNLEPGEYLVSLDDKWLKHNIIVSADGPKCTYHNYSNDHKQSLYELVQAGFRVRDCKNCGWKWGQMRHGLLLNDESVILEGVVEETQTIDGDGDIYWIL